jgi:hypothetical protein
MFQLKRPARLIACGLVAGALAATLGACTVQSAQSSGTQSQASLASELRAVVFGKGYLERAACLRRRRPR